MAIKRARQSVEEQLKFRTDLEKLILEISSNFINLECDKIDAGICKALGKIAKFADADRSVVFLFQDNTQKMSNTQEWVAKNTTKQKSRLQNIDTKNFPWFIKQIRDKKTIHIPRVVDLPKDAEPEKREFLRENIKSLLNVPIVSRNKLIGFVGFHAVKQEIFWPDDIINLLKVVGDIFSNALESKRVEDTLRNEKDIYETTINGLPGIFLQLGEDGKYISWNKNLETVTGYSGEELLKMTPLDVTPEEEKKLVGDSINQVIKRGWYSGESTILTKDGKKIPYRFLGTRFKKNHSQYIIGTGIDISDHKKAEAELHKEMNFIESIISSLPDIFYLTDVSGKILRWNKNMNITGYSDEEILKASPSDFFEPKDKALMKKKMKEVFSKGSASFESNLVTKSGKKIPYRFSGTQANIDGTRFLVGMGINISDQKKAEDALKKTLQKLDMAQKIAKLGSWYWDIKSNMIQWSDEVYRQVGEKPQSFTPTYEDFLKFIAEEDKDRLDKEVRKTLKTKNPFSIEFGLVTKQGKSKVIRGKGYVVTDKEGNVIGLMGTGLDITKRKKAERERERLIEIIEGTSDFVGIADEKSHVKYLNSAGRKMTGLTSDEDSSKYKIADFHPDWAAKKVLEEGIPQSEKTGVWRAETALLNAEDKEFPVSQVIMSHKKPDGTIDHYSTIIRDMTEQKKAEEDLLKSEKKYRSIFESTTDGFIQVSMGGRVLDANKTMLNMLGYTLPELKKLTYQQLTPKKWHKIEAELVKNEVLVKGYVDAFKKEYIRKDGSIIPTEIIGWTTRDAKGNINSMWGVVRDITERKQAEKELLDEKQFTDHIINSLPGVFFLNDAQGNYLRWNKNFEKTTGYSANEISKMNALDFYLEKDRANLQHQVRELIKQKEAVTVEVNIVLKNGNVVPYHMATAPLSVNKKTLISGMGIDITDRKKAETALKDSEEKYRKLIEGANDPIFVVNSEKILVDANQKAAEILKIPKEELIGKHFTIVHPSEDKKHYESVFESVVKKKRVYAPDLFLQDKYKTRIPVDMSASIMDIAGKKLIQGIFRDTTERKKAEEALKQKDRQIRRAYVDVFSTVTGGKLIIMTKDELKDDLGKPLTDLFTISSYEELSQSRTYLKEAIENKLPYIEQTDEVILAVDESLTNAVKHAGGGKFQVFEKDNSAQVLITDTGPGIEFTTLPKATLLSGFSTRQTLGAGFSIMLELSDRVLLATDSKGTQIVLEIREEEEEETPLEEIFAV